MSARQKSFGSLGVVRASELKIATEVHLTHRVPEAYNIFTVKPENSRDNIRC